LRLLGDLQGSQVVSHKIVREGLEDRIEILVRCLEFTLGNVDVGAIQMSWQAARVDFDYLFKKLHGTVQIPPSPQHFSLCQENLR
jgi:hypothetical protein